MEILTGSVRSHILTRYALALFTSWTLLLARAEEPKLTGDRFDSSEGEITLHPINHATFVIGWKDNIIYVDPVGGSKKFEGLPKPNLILVTDIHGDHQNNDTLKAVVQANTKIIAPEAVAEKFDPDLRAKTTVLANGQTQTAFDVKIEAVPMYNLTADRLKFHSKGRGNGYVLTIANKRFYISGDTEDIPEMRNLKNVDIAFVCMNLPYTMTVDQAADAVRAFKPKVVYPYHYRGSDLEKFKSLIGSDLGIDVRIRDWYKD